MSDATIANQGSQSDTPDSRLARMLAALWQRNRPLMTERLTLLKEACASLATGTLTETQRAAAASTAHKLCGTLGTFGYPRGTEVARELEGLYEGKSADSDRVLVLTQELDALLLPSLTES